MQCEERDECTHVKPISFYYGVDITTAQGKGKWVPWVPAVLGTNRFYCSKPVRSIFEHGLVQTVYGKVREVVRINFLSFYSKSRRWDSVKRTWSGFAFSFCKSPGNFQIHNTLDIDGAFRLEETPTNIRYVHSFRIISSKKSFLVCLHFVNWMWRFIWDFLILRRKEIYGRGR